MFCGVFSSTRGSGNRYYFTWLAQPGLGGDGCGIGRMTSRAEVVSGRVVHGIVRHSMPSESWGKGILHLRLPCFWPQGWGARGRGKGNEANGREGHIFLVFFGERNEN